MHGRRAAGKQKEKEKARVIIFLPFSLSLNAGKKKKTYDITPSPRQQRKEEYKRKFNNTHIGVTIFSPGTKSGRLIFGQSPASWFLRRMLLLPAGDGLGGWQSRVQGVVGGRGISFR